MQLPLKAIQYFTVAARLESYTEAAKALYVSHGAVLAQVKKLEQWLGCKLFHSHHGRISLTLEGKQFATLVSPAIDQIEHAVTEIKSDTKDKIIISMTPSLGAYFVLPNMRQFKQDFPTVDIELHYAVEGHFHADSHFIFAAEVGEFTETDQQFRLFSGSVVPVCGQGYYKDNDLDHHLLPEIITGHTLLHNYDKEEWRHWFSKHGVKLTESLIGGMIFGGFHLLHTALLENQGVALCPWVLLEKEIRNKELRLLSSLESKSQRCYYFRTDKPCRPTIQTAITEWFLEKAREKRQLANTIIQS